MKLVVGLGNPGKKYEGTRHNIGFMVLDHLAEQHQADRPKAKFQGRFAELRLGSGRAALLWPETFMNLSGGSVAKAVEFYKLENEDVLIVCDDFHLPLGKLRVRAKGSSGGQKGLADTLRRLGSEEVPRLRIGVGPVPPEWNPADFVLGRFAASEQAALLATVHQAADAVADWARLGINDCMNQYN